MWRPGSKGSGNMRAERGRFGIAVAVTASLASTWAWAQTQGPNGEAPTPTSEITLADTEVAKLQEGKYTAALLWHTSSDFVNAVTAGATDEFNRLGVTVVATTDAGFDAAKQKSDIETVLAKKPSVILALPLDPTTSAEAFRPAVEAGTKIVLLSNTPAGYVQGRDFVAVVTDDLFQMGKQAADALAAAIGKKGEVAWIYHDAQYYVTNQRDNAFKTTIETDYPEIEIVAEQGLADPARAEEIANALLLKNPDLDGIYATWAEPAEGVLAAIRAAGNTHTKIVTLDLSEPIALDMVQGGNVTAIVADQAYELGRAMATVAGYGLLGKEAPPFIVAPVVTVTKANVSEGWQTSLHRDPPQSVLDAAD
jgi:ribose transport system substrate-binding protein